MNSQDELQSTFPQQVAPVERVAVGNPTTSQDGGITPAIIPIILPPFAGDDAE